MTLSLWVLLIKSIPSNFWSLETFPSPHQPQPPRRVWRRIFGTLLSVCLEEMISEHWTSYFKWMKLISVALSVSMYMHSISVLRKFGYCYMVLATDTPHFWCFCVLVVGSNLVRRGNHLLSVWTFTFRNIGPAFVRCQESAVDINHVVSNK